MVLTTYNRKIRLQDTLEWLSEVDGIANIIIADNGSTDGSTDWPSSQSYEYLWFDEGVQGYGKLWNAVLENFETEDHIVFMEAGVYPEKGSLLELISALHTEGAGIANPVTNYYNDDGNRITGRDVLALFAQNSRIRQNRKMTQKTLFSNWRIWAIKRNVFDKLGRFREELKSPEDVLTDYTIRMIQNNLEQTVCRRACAWESFSRGEEIYAGTELSGAVT